MNGAKLPDEELSRDELLKLVRMQAATIKRLEKQVEELFAKLKEKNPTERLDESYSQKAEEQRKKALQDKKKGKKTSNRSKPTNKRRKGRITSGRVSSSPLPVRRAIKKSGRMIRDNGDGGEYRWSCQHELTLVWDRWAPEVLRYDMQQHHWAAVRKPFALRPI